MKELRSNGSFILLRKDEKITRSSRQPGTVTVNDATVRRPQSADLPNRFRSRSSPTSSTTRPTTRKSPAIPGIWYGWNGSITGGATVLQSTSYGQTLTAGISLIRAIPTVSYLPRRTRTTFNLLQSYGKLTQPTVPKPPHPRLTPLPKRTSSILTSSTTNTSLHASFVLAGLSFDHNYSQGLNCAQLYGGGIGWTAILTPTQELDLKTDVHYQRQNFVAPTPNQDLIGSSFGAAYSRIFPPKLLFTSSGTYIQSWNNFNAYSAIGAVGLAVPVYHRFSLSLNLLNTYLNNPAIGFKRNSFQFVTGVTYTLH